MGSNLDWIFEDAKARMLNFSILQNNRIPELKLCLALPAINHLLLRSQKGSNCLPGHYHSAGDVRRPQIKKASRAFFSVCGCVILAILTQAGSAAHVQRE